MADKNGDLKAPRVYVYTYVDKQLVTMNERIKRVEFEDNLKKVDRACIELNNHDLTVFDDDRWATGSHIYVSYGYYGNMSLPVHMRIKKVCGGKSLNVEAVNAAAYGLDLKKKSKTWEHKTYSEVVREVASTNGMPGSIVQDTDEVHETVTQSNQSDGVFLRELADRQGFDFRVVGSSIHWAERDLSPAPVREFNYYSTGDKSASVLDFGIDTDITRRPGRVKSSKRNPLDRTTVEETADNLHDKDRSTLTRWALTPGDEDGKFTLGVDPSENDPVTGTTLVNGNKKSAKGLFRTSNRGTVKMWVSAEGSPSTHAGDVVQVTGLGKKISGKYVVKAVKHSVEARGRYIMTLDLTTDGVNSNKTGKSSGKSNLPEAIGRLKTEWQRFIDRYRGSLEVYLEGFESLISQIDSDIVGLSVSTYTHAKGNGIVERLGVLRGYLYGFSTSATESSKTEQLVASLVQAASSCYAAAGDLVTSVIESGLEEQAGKRNESELADILPNSLTFDDESGQTALIADPAIKLEKKDANGSSQITGGTVNNKPIPADLLESMNRASEDVGID